MRILTTDQDKIKYTDFLKNHPRCNFQASIEWGEVKENWIKEIVVSEDENGNIIGSLMIWIRKIPLFGNLMYSPRGLICDIHNNEVIEDLANRS